MENNDQMFKYIIVDRQSVTFKLLDGVDSIDDVIAHCEYIKKNFNIEAFKNVLIRPTNPSLVMFIKKNGTMLTYQSARAEKDLKSGEKNDLGNIIPISHLHEIFKGTKENVYSLFYSKVKVPVFSKGVEINFDFDIEALINNSHDLIDAEYELEFLAKEQLGRQIIKK